MTTDKRDITGQNEYREATHRHAPTRRILRTRAGWLTFTAAIFLTATILNIIAGRALQ